MEIEGTVTYINEPFLFFVLDDHIKVHITILLAKGNYSLMPGLGANVAINSAFCNHQFGNTYVLCDTCRISSTKGFKVAENGLLKFAEENTFCVSDIITLDKNAEVLKKYFTDVTKFSDIDLVEIITSIFETVRVAHVKGTCLGSSFSLFDLMTVSKCTFVDTESDKYSGFPYWSFGVHSIPKKDMFLFGYLFVAVNYGFFMIRDDEHKVVIKIYAGDYDVSTLVDKFVIIKKYRVFTEIYNDAKIGNLCYILVDFEDIYAVKSTQRGSENMLLYENISNIPLKESGLKFWMDFQLIYRSEITIGENGKPEYYLEVVVTVKNEKSVNLAAFIILPTEFIKVAALFRPNECYRVYYTLLPTVSNNELSRLKPNHEIFGVTSGSYFTRNPLKKLFGGPEKPLMDIRDCKDYLKTQNKTICSFQGVVKYKKFTNPLASRTKKRHKLFGFGTPGSKTHSLVFCQGVGAQEVIYLDCYLNNWENMLMPLGLLPQMRVAVKNVYPQAGKYTKTGPFTTFEVLSYEPKVDFETTNLHYIGEHVDWGQQSYLGLGYLMPLHVLVWGRVLVKAIYDFKIISSCASCKFVNECNGPCLQCSEEERKLDVTIVLHPYHISLHQDLSEENFDKRLHHCHWMINMKSIIEIGCPNIQYFLTQYL